MLDNAMDSLGIFQLIFTDYSSRVLKSICIIIKQHPKCTRFCLKIQVPVDVFAFTYIHAHFLSVKYSLNSTFRRMCS